MVKRYYKQSQIFNLKGGRFFIPLLLVVTGVGFISYVIFPLALFGLKDAPMLVASQVTSPIPEVLSTSITALSGVDYTKASNWFPSSTKSRTVPTLVSSYSLTISKLNIKDAVVSTTSDDLFKNLVHYVGSSLPGEKGNTVVFGHSTLPQLFNPKNYKTIFSTLHTLRVGDEFVVNIEGVAYKYLIFEIKVIEPEDISVLEQKYDNSYITLVTCTPPGTYWKRLIIKGRVESPA